MALSINVGADHSAREVFAKLDQLAQTQAGRDTKLKLASSVFSGLQLKEIKQSRTGQNDRAQTFGDNMPKLKQMVSNLRFGQNSDAIVARFKTLEHAELTVGALRDAMRLVAGPGIAHQPLVPQGVQPQQAVQNLLQQLLVQNKAVQLSAHPVNQNANGPTLGHLQLMLASQTQI